MNARPERLTEVSAWHRFVLRHQRPANLWLHLVSAWMFFGGLITAVATGGAHGVWVTLASGPFGAAAHHLTQDGSVTVHEATTSPSVVAYNARMWGRIARGRYGSDIRAANEAAARVLATRTVLVTGAASGLGEATVLRFLRRGWTVVATMRRADRRGEALREAAGLDAVRLQIRELDVTDGAHRAAVAAEFPHLDALVNAAGVGLFGALEDLSEADLREQLEVNFFGTALLTRAMVPALRRAGGVVVNVSSPAAVTGFPWTSAYCASKAAVEGLTEALYYELAPAGIAVRLVVPSGQRSAFLANSRWVTPETSTFGVEMAVYRDRMDVGQATAAAPDAAARAVLTAVEDTNTPLRSLVGTPVRLLSAVRRFVPQRLRHAMMTRAFRRTVEAS